ncbi:hypothetical protein V5799_033536 [Amblyomma americanum]|uniref:Microplusin n=1 Tax=Amblyomma americanum TaxID=6943 RepID=A0AAQ4DN19_AMBAM
MKFLFACVLFACSAVFASARQAAVCFASEDQIKEQAACVREQAGEFNARLDDAVTNLGCTDDLCAVQKLCSFLSTDQALRALFTRPEATLLRNLSLRCTAAAALVGTPDTTSTTAAAEQLHLDNKKSNRRIYHGTADYAFKNDMIQKLVPGEMPRFRLIKASFDQWALNLPLLKLIVVTQVPQAFTLTSEQRPLLAASA